MASPSDDSLGYFEIVNPIQTTSEGQAKYGFAEINHDLSITDMKSAYDSVAGNMPAHDTSIAASYDVLHTLSKASLEAETSTNQCTINMSAPINSISEARGTLLEPRLAPKATMEMNGVKYYRVIEYPANNSKIIRGFEFGPSGIAYVSPGADNVETKVSPGHSVADHRKAHPVQTPYGYEAEPGTTASARFKLISADSVRSPRPTPEITKLMIFQRKCIVRSLVLRRFGLVQRKQKPSRTPAWMMMWRLCLRSAIHCPIKLHGEKS